VKANTRNNVLPFVRPYSLCSFRHCFSSFCMSSPTYLYDCCAVTLMTLFTDIRKCGSSRDICASNVFCTLFVYAASVCYRHWQCRL